VLKLRLSKIPPHYMLLLTTRPAGYKLSLNQPGAIQDACPRTHWMTSPGQCATDPHVKSKAFTHHAHHPILSNRERQRPRCRQRSLPIHILSNVTTTACFYLSLESHPTSGTQTTWLRGCFDWPELVSHRRAVSCLSLAVSCAIFELNEGGRFPAVRDVHTVTLRLGLAEYGRPGHKGVSIHDWNLYRWLPFACIVRAGCWCFLGIPAQKRIDLHGRTDLGIVSDRSHDTLSIVASTMAQFPTTTSISPCAHRWRHETRSYLESSLTTR
jgi:hypothetical protein